MVKDLEVPPEECYSGEFPLDSVEYQLIALNRNLRHPCSQMEEAPLHSALFSLQIVIANLETLGIDRNHLTPLFTLAEALDDLSIGKKNPLFAPLLTSDGKEKRGGKRLRSSVAFNMARAAAAITLSGRGHMKGARQRAARKLGIQADKLETFRRNISTGKISDPTATFQYWHHVNHFEQHPLEKRQWVIEALLKNLTPIRTA